MPNRCKNKQATPVPKRNLRHSTIDHIDQPIPPEPDPPQESSPLETNHFNALDDSDSGTDDMNDPDNTLPLSSLSVPCPPILPPPSNLELSHKLDNLILLMSTSQRNYETMKNEVDQLKQTHAPSRPTTHHPNVANLLSVRSSSYLERKRGVAAGKSAFTLGTFVVLCTLGFCSW